MRFRVQVYVRLKPTVNDPQGNAVLGSLHALGFDSVEDVRVGKYLTLTVEAQNSTSAQHDVDQMCAKLLTNPVIEAYESTILPDRT